MNRSGLGLIRARAEPTADGSRRTGATATSNPDVLLQV